MPDRISTQRAAKRRRFGRIALWTGLTVVVLLVAVVGVLSISDWNFARGRVASMAGSRIHRDVRIGDLKAHLLSMEPRVWIERIVIANPTWVGDRDLATVEKLEFAISLKDLLRGDLVFEE